MLTNTRAICTNHTEKILETLSASLTKMILNRRPKIDPLGTPHLKVSSSDSLPLKLTY